MGRSGHISVSGIRTGESGGSSIGGREGYQGGCQRIPETLHSRLGAYACTSGRGLGYRGAFLEDLWRSGTLVVSWPPEGHFLAQYPSYKLILGGVQEKPL